MLYILYISKMYSKHICAYVYIHTHTHTHRVHGILQARILEGVAITFSKGSSQPRD